MFRHLLFTYSINTINISVDISMVTPRMLNNYQGTNHEVLSIALDSWIPSFLAYFEKAEKNTEVLY